MPIMKNLQSDELLNKCLHGQTQNSNEAINGVIWSRVPKSTFVSKGTIEMGAHSAVIDYNGGAKGVLKVLEYFGLHGYVTRRASLSADVLRVEKMQIKSSEKGKKRRKQLRSIKKGFSDTLKQKENYESYVSGGF